MTPAWPSTCWPASPSPRTGEKSGIFSTAAGAMAAYRSARALALADGAGFDPARFPSGGDTIYLCSPARYQALAAPVLVAFLEQLRAATYQAFAAGTLRLPVTLVLDEVANIAPLPDLPAMVSEGGGQGLLTLACLQDLSQARARWGTAADGFFSLFGAKVLLPGVGDLRTLEAVSRLAGQGDVAVRSVNTSAWWSGRPSANTTYSTRRQDRLPVDQVHSLAPGTALVIAGARPPQPVRPHAVVGVPAFLGGCTGPATGPVAGHHSHSRQWRPQPGAPPAAAITAPTPAGGAQTERRPARELAAGAGAAPCPTSPTPPVTKPVPHVDWLPACSGPPPPSRHGLCVVAEGAFARPDVRLAPPAFARGNNMGGSPAFAAQAKLAWAELPTRPLARVALASCTNLDEGRGRLGERASS